MLIRHLLSEFPSPDVTVSTGASKAPAIALYERLGFRQCRTNVPVPGLPITEFVLTCGDAGR